MISLEKIVASNLEMLKSQEAELLKSLNFVQKAKELFEAQWGLPSKPKKRGKPSRSSARPAVRGIRRKKSTARAARKKNGEKRVSHMTRIMEILRQKKTPVTSGELIQTLFRQQKADKNLKHFRLLIYPVLTKAYKNGTLKLKGGKITLPASAR